MARRWAPCWKRGMPEPRVIDGRDMEPPEPLELALAALATLAPGEELVMLLRCEPLPLYSILERNGFSYRSKLRPTARTRVTDSESLAASSMQPTLSFEQAPPISVPYRFFLTAPLFGAVAGLILACSGRTTLAVALVARRARDDPSDRGRLHAAGDVRFAAAIRGGGRRRQHLAAAPGRGRGASADHGGGGVPRVGVPAGAAGAVPARRAGVRRGAGPVPDGHGHCAAAHAGARHEHPRAARGGVRPAGDGGAGRDAGGHAGPAGDICNRSGRCSR